jgi:hypothetical protein
MSQRETLPEKKGLTTCPERGNKAENSFGGILTVAEESIVTTLFTCIYFLFLLLGAFVLLTIITVEKPSPSSRRKISRSSLAKIADFVIDKAWLLAVLCALTLIFLGLQRSGAISIDHFSAVAFSG